MKLLTKEETQGLDSTSKTINKWKEFFKTALPNLGYKDSLLEDMYPYSKGIPMIDGSYMPVSETTGRAFFKMSWADKFAQLFSMFTTGGSTGNRAFSHIRRFIGAFWADDYKNFKNFFKDATEEDYNTFKTEYNSSDYRESMRTEDASLTPVFNKYWKIFIDNSKISMIGLHNSSCEYDDVGEIEQSVKDKLASREIPDPTYANTYGSGTCVVIYCSLITDVFDKISQEDIIRILDAALANTNTNVLSRIRSFGEVYLQDYLVLSLNPIDKFMCSTKQAFSSCMSIAKQNETSGTYSTPAFGLPSIFPSDSVFMLFLTPGKHKNMYWESDEWVKSPDQRDKEKAYKYLKMTCRALTYKGTPQKAVKDYVEELRKRNAKCENSDVKVLSDLYNALHKIDVDTERLYVGRQYSACGEDYIWQEVIEVVLAQHGISTSMAYATQTDDLCKAVRRTSNCGFGDNIRSDHELSSSILRVSKKQYLRKGMMDDNRVAAIDRYGYVRGIYYDNLQLYFKKEVLMCRDKMGRAFVPSKEMYILDYPLERYQDINVGTSRYGSGGITWFSQGSGLDMFKIMLGQQSYQTLNSYIKVCSHCHEVITDQSSSVQYNGTTICAKCAEELQLETCSCCGVVYSKVDPAESTRHGKFNIMEFINPKNYKNLPPKYVCRDQLELASSNNGTTTAICAHCGEVMGVRSKGSRSIRSQMTTIFPSLTVQGEFKGYRIYVQLCNDCLRKAVMCDKCHRLIFLDSITDACLLLPNRRIICPDCVDSIRMQKDKRKKYTDVLSMLKYDPKESEKDPTMSKLECEVAEKADDLGLMLDRGQKTITKDVRKQIRSYLQGHPDEGAPALKSSNLPFPEEVAPVLEEV